MQKGNCLHIKTKVNFWLISTIQYRIGVWLRSIFQLNFIWALKLIGGSHWRIEILDPNQIVYKLVNGSSKKIWKKSKKYKNIVNAPFATDYTNQKYHPIIIIMQTIEDIYTFFYQQKQQQKKKRRDSIKVRLIFAFYSGLHSVRKVIIENKFHVSSLLLFFGQFTAQ